MKKRILVLFILLVCLSNVYSQNNSDSTNSKVRGIISVNPLQLLFGELRLNYEIPVQNNLSMVLGTGYVYFYFPIQIQSNFNAGDDGLGQLQRVNGTELSFGIKKYFNKQFDHEGLYFYPLGFAKYFYQTENYNSYAYVTKVYSIGFQLLIGYKAPSNNCFSYDIYAGIGGRLIYENYYTQDPNFQIFNENIKDRFYTPQLGFCVSYTIKKK
jgi:hypothetical protein